MVTTKQIFEYWRQAYYNKIGENYPCMGNGIDFVVIKSFLRRNGEYHAMNCMDLALRSGAKRHLADVLRDSAICQSKAIDARIAKAIWENNHRHGMHSFAIERFLEYRDDPEVVTEVLQQLGV